MLSLRSPISETLATKQSRRIHAVAPDAMVAEAVRRMVEEAIGALLVIGDHELLGIFTERDVLARVISLNLDPSQTRIRQVMTPEPLCLRPTTPIGEALKIAAGGGYRHFPVVENDRLVGLVSVRDLMSWLVRAQQDQIDGLIQSMRSQYRRKRYLVDPDDLEA